MKKERKKVRKKKKEKRKKKNEEYAGTNIYFQQCLTNLKRQFF